MTTTPAAAPECTSTWHGHRCTRRPHDDDLHRETIETGPGATQNWTWADSRADNPRPTPHERPTRYEVSAVPFDHPEASELTVRVELRGNGLWTVQWRGQCYSTDGRLDMEPLASARTPEWLAAHRFPLDEAMRQGRQLAHRLHHESRVFQDPEPTPTTT